MGKAYRSRILVWEKTTPYKEGPDLVITRDELPLPFMGQNKYVMWAQPFSRRIYISDNCKYKDVWWAHESAHFEMGDSPLHRAPRLATLYDEMLADMKAVVLCGAARTRKALEWGRDNGHEHPSDKFLRNMNARIAFVDQLGEMLEKYKNS